VFGARIGFVGTVESSVLVIHHADANILSSAIIYLKAESVGLVAVD